MKVLPQGALAQWSPVMTVSEQIYSGFLPSSVKSLFEDELKKAYPTLGAGYQIASVGVETWSCYKKFRGGEAVGVIPKTLCAGSVLLGFLDLLSPFIPNPEFKHIVTIIHVVWSKGEDIYEIVVKGSEPAAQPFLQALGSHPVGALAQLSPDLSGQTYSGDLTPSVKSLFEDELKKAYPTLDAGYEIASVGLETWSCYKASVSK